MAVAQGLGVRGRSRKWGALVHLALTGVVLSPHPACPEPGVGGRARAGFPVPAFPRLWSTRPMVSRVGGLTWPPANEFGMDFRQGQTQAHAQICEWKGR